MFSIYSFRTPALGEMQWRKLLSDLLDLQRKVYKCVEPAICYEVNEPQHTYYGYKYLDYDIVVIH